MSGGIQGTWYRFVRFWSQVLFILLFGFRAYWRGRVPAKGGVLLVANHQSFFDPVIVGLGLSRRVSYLARSELFDNKLFSWLIRSVGAFPMRRGIADTGAIKTAIEKLKAGEVVLLFPEGTRTPDGSVGSFHPGMCAIAARARVPMLPVAIDGAFEAWPRNHKVFRFRRLRVGYGRPLRVDSKNRKDYPFISEQIRGIIMDTRRAIRGRCGE